MLPFFFVILSHCPDGVSVANGTVPCQREHHAELLCTDQEPFKDKDFASTLGGQMYLEEQRSQHQEAELILHSRDAQARWASPSQGGEACRLLCPTEPITIVVAAVGLCVTNTFTCTLTNSLSCIYCIMWYLYIRCSLYLSVLGYHCCISACNLSPALPPSQGKVVNKQLSECEHVFPCLPLTPRPNPPPLDTLVVMRVGSEGSPLRTLSLRSLCMRPNGFRGLLNVIPVTTVITSESQQ